MQFEFNNLKVYRKQRDLTQEQIAEKLGVSRQAVAKWERGDSLPSIENVIALADLYEISVDSLVRNLASTLSDDRDGHYLFGVTRINEKGQITLPQRARDVFGLKDSDSLLILGDEKRGIALVKISEITEE